MRIAMIGSKGMPATVGGIERHVEELSVRLAADGFRVTVYGRPWYTGAAPYATRSSRGVRLVTLPSLSLKHFDAISHTFLATLHAMRERADVYHFHGVGPSLLAFLPRIFRPRARVVATFHCVDRQHEKWGVCARAALTVGEWAACWFPHATMTVAPTLAAYCRIRYGRDTTCTPNGVTERTLITATDAAPTLAEFGLMSRRYLLVVARLVPHKEVHTTIAAFRQLRREYAEFRDLQLAIVGGSAFTDAYTDELRCAAGGDPAVRFLGEQHGAVLDVLYQHCLAFVHASRSEGLPLVVLEAAANGAVPVVSDIPEHRDIVRRIGGFTFPVGSPAACAATLALLLHCAPQTLEQVGRSIRAVTARSYSWDRTAAATGEQYYALVGAGVRTPARAGRAAPLMLARAT